MAVLNKVQESELYQSIKSQSKSNTSPKNYDYKRSNNFFVSTFQELRKVQWPGLGHVLQWSLVVLIFCTIFAAMLGYADNVFSSTVVVADCISKVNKDETNDTTSDCFREYFESLTLQG